MIQDIIIYCLGNLPVVTLCLAIIIALFQKYLGKNHQPFRHVLLPWLFLLPVGLSGVWGFTVHAFFPSYADKMIGWAYSPFEFEVAMANLAFGLAGIFSFRASNGFRKAVVLFSAVLLWGAAYGHVHQMIVNHNFNPGNAGTIFWTDILVPLLLAICLY